MNSPNVYFRARRRARDQPACTGHICTRLHRANAANDDRARTRPSEEAAGARIEKSTSMMMLSERPTGRSSLAPSSHIRSGLSARAP